MSRTEARTVARDCTAECSLDPSCHSEEPWADEWRSDGPPYARESSEWSSDGALTVRGNWVYVGASWRASHVQTSGVRTTGKLPELNVCECGEPSALRASAACPLAPSASERPASPL